MELFYAPQDQEFLKRERAKARELRNSQWWRNQLGKGVCYHCQKKFQKSELTMDHLVPVSRGGRSTKSNVVVACKACNTGKKNLTVFELQTN